MLDKWARRETAGPFRFWEHGIGDWFAEHPYSARREEALMIEQFPEQYPAYMKRTKMPLPFVL